MSDLLALHRAEIVRLERERDAALQDVAEFREAWADWKKQAMADYETIRMYRNTHESLIASRDAALALAERRAGEIATLRAALTDYRDRIANITSGWGDHLPRDVMYSLSTSHYSVAALLDAALAAPPPAAAAAGEDAMRVVAAAQAVCQWEAPDAVTSEYRRDMQALRDAMRAYDAGGTR
jgi:hypothetical protein